MERLRQVQKDGVRLLCALGYIGELTKPVKATDGSWKSQVSLPMDGYTLDYLSLGSITGSFIAEGGTYSEFGFFWKERSVKISDLGVEFLSPDEMRSGVSGREVITSFVGGLEVLAKEFGAESISYDPKRLRSCNRRWVRKLFREMGFVKAKEGKTVLVKQLEY